MNPIASALICDKWELPLYVQIEDEGARNKSSRSYLHYIHSHAEMVSAKCLATEWLFADVERGLSVIEYFGGAGVVSCIVKNMIQPARHIAIDRDERCVCQLKGLLGEENAREGNARKEMLALIEYFDMHVLDFPKFTALTATQAYSNQLAKIFSTNPRYVVITDTACSYLGVHKRLYRDVLGSGPIANPREYTLSFSQFLMARYGYSVRKAAYRHGNAAYYLCAQGPSAIEEKRFAIGECDHGFQLR
jgi:hypothetical protein